MFSTVNNADTKTLATTIGGSAIGSFTSLASNLTFVAAATWQNRDSLASQVGCNTSSSSYGGAATALTYTAVNMANSQTLQFAFGHTTATDYVICESLLVELLKGE
jgi:hypothetical protein